MKEENFMDLNKHTRIFHDGYVQAWESKEHKGWIAFYNCFLEKDRVGRFLFSLNLKDAKEFVNNIQKWIDNDNLDPAGDQEKEVNEK